MKQKNMTSLTSTMKQRSMTSLMSTMKQKNMTSLRKNIYMQSMIMKKTLIQVMKDINLIHLEQESVINIEQ